MAKSEMYDHKTGYTDELTLIREEMRTYAKFIGVLVRLNILEYRRAQILVSNNSQRIFENLRSGAV